MNRLATRKLTRCTCGSSYSLMVHGLVVAHDCPPVFCNWNCVCAASIALNIWAKNYCKAHFVWYLGSCCPLCDMGQKPGGNHG